MSDPVIETEGLVKRYNGVTALDEVGFSVGAGEAFALVGPNGAGKTTLLRLLTHILTPDAGVLRLFGEERLRRVLGRVGYMPEERGLYKTLTPMECVTFFARLKGLGAEAAARGARAALDAVGMLGHARRRMEELSKGMAQRVQFAATMAHGPDLLILDEPFSGLDPVSARAMQEQIRRLRGEGRTVLLSTHNMEHAEKLCDRLLMVYRGRVCLYGSLHDIRARFSDEALLVECASPVPPTAAARMELDGEFRARLYPREGMRRRDVLEALVAAGADVLRFEPAVPTLEDIFVRVAGAEAAEAIRATRAANEATVL